MKKQLILILSALVVLALGQITYGEDPILEVPIVISPNTLNLRSEGTWVTVHAEIAYGLVDAATVTLNGITVKATFADNRGELVAKFLIGDVKNIVTPGSANLTLFGTTKDGDAFAGMDTIKVVSVSGK